MSGKKRRGGRQGYRGAQQERQVRHETSTARNSFNRLSELPEEGHEADELNPQVLERFGGHQVSNTGAITSHIDHVPANNATETNNDIRDYFEDAKKSVPGGSWLQTPEIPSPAEIMSGPIGSGPEDHLIGVGARLRPNKIEGAYESNEEYLGTQYQLLREDAIRPLREAIHQVRAAPYLDEAEYVGSGVGIYDPVYTTSVVFSPRGLAVRVAFSLRRAKKRVRWEQSKRLITGTIVALSPADDNFQHKCILAIVAARSVALLNQSQPEIDIFFSSAEDMEIDPMKKWVMVECRSSFFEASRHTLLALQHMMRESFPLSEHLVRAQVHVYPPKYDEESRSIDMSSVVTMEEMGSFRNVDILTNWPENQSHGLDTSQSRALRRILTNRLAIVQGPPGTGKTYVSVIALKILLSNLREDDPPIIVTCQTNHALDQLLRHVAEFESEFIRLGGRSQDKDKIKKRTLYEVRQNLLQAEPKSRSRLMVRATITIKNLTEAMQKLLEPLAVQDSALDYKMLVKLGLLTERQAESLEMEAKCAMGISPDTQGIHLEQWLGKCLVRCLRPVMPDDFGMEFEEEDFEVEQLQELEAEAVAQDDDIDALRGPCMLLSDNWTGKGNLKTENEIRDILRKTEDLTTIPVSDRGTIYNYLHRQAKLLITNEFRRLASKYEEAVHQRKIGLWEQDAKILHGQRLIGMTTTGLSKYRGLIASLRPRVVLVEEAAETLEAPVASACLPTLEHLILVGDHQQLRPHCQTHDLEDEPFFFNFSLFERMVLNGVELDCLTRQRRMIPEIRRLLEPIYGATLKDHRIVKDSNNRPPVEGMGGCNSYFFTHEWHESRDVNMSALNDREASMVVGFFDYLVLNGVDPNKITVLTFYNGQRKLIHKKIRQHPNLAIQSTTALNIVTVDSYQGEENDIVLLSLVRSNPKRSIGFLSVDNRVCVALSRAKRGFYIFGNAEMLACESGTWAEVVNIMYGKKVSSNIEKKRHVGYFLPIQCDKHGRKTWMKDPEDWELINGGCDEKCLCILPCGHNCPYRCHPFSKDLINCTQKCKRRVQPCGHPCTAVCCDPCRCGVCEIRSNGNRAMLKHNPTAHASKSTFRSRSMNQSSSSSIAHGTAHSGHSSGGVDQWTAYVNGGAEQDDAAFLHKSKEQEAKYEAAGLPKLIEVFPEEKKTLPASTNTSLLGGIGIPARKQKPRLVVLGKPSKTKENVRGDYNLGLMD